MLIFFFTCAIDRAGSQGSGRPHQVGEVAHLGGLISNMGRDPFNQNFQPVRPGKVVHLKRWTSF